VKTQTAAEDSQNVGSAGASKASPGSATPAGYSPELDTLRAIAIFSVLVSHYLPQGSIFNRLQSVVQQGPTVGVPLFFALSGFLITRILVQSRGTVDTGKTTTGHALGIFYARRFLRIFPIYYLTLFLGVLFKYPNVRRALFWHLAYLSNVYYMHRGAFDKGPAPVFWTLSVEEQFYLVWPLLFLMLPARALPAFTMVTALAGAVYAGWASPRSLVFNTLMPTHLTYLALGSYLGLRAVTPLGSPTALRQSMRYFLWAIPICGLLYAAVHLCLSAGVARMQLQNTARYAGSAFAFAWIVARLARGVGGPIGVVLRWRPLTFIGRISYGVYILQFFVTQMIDRAVPAVSAHLGAVATGWLLQSFIVRVIAILAVATVSFFFFEQPINNLKHHFPYVRRSGKPQLTPVG
jgi:peptidoglycan/LPS O-acetylase OafA/YrhL